MGFEDLEQKLELFFQKESVKTDLHQKAHLKELIIGKFSAKKYSIWQKLNAFFVSKYIPSVLAIAIIICLIPLVNNQLYAGEINSSEGLVEIVRNGKKIILDGKSKLKIGDEIIVNSSASAKLNLKNEFESEIFENSKVKVESRNSLFLIKGQLNNNLKSGKISTNKGEISAKFPSHFTVDVTDSGETKIFPIKNSVSVQNWQGEKIEIAAGEELRLRSDTRLANKKLPQGLDLSNSQIQAIRSKLFIARTKALNYVENSIRKSYKQSNEDLLSAQKTFKSITQVLKNSREMHALLPRENLNVLKIKDVYDLLSKKTNNQELLNEVKSVEKLLDIIKDKRHFEFNLPQTESLSFNRYVVVSRIFANEDSSFQKLGNILRKQYIRSFARNIFNEELRIDQISALNTEIKKLPHTTMTKFFLLQVGEILPTDLQELLSEKIKKDF